MFMDTTHQFDLTLPKLYLLFTTFGFSSHIPATAYVYASYTVVFGCPCVGHCRGAELHAVGLFPRSGAPCGGGVFKFRLTYGVSVPRSVV